ncbi:MAG: UDP-N-acetylglucosamine 2-epimerase (non-hydrolyzing) [Chloroflexi bacterium]|nr:UDP-N-acetylglucosamine 2-epimerase (non-hydrolyzing) [Chloroflexota bacterium]
MRILSVFGTRPEAEAVKMAPVVQELKRTPGVESFVCVTAQHREMLDQVLTLFEIKPDVDLDLMRADQSLAELSASIFRELDPVLVALKPDWVLVQGDTTTVAITSLLAYYRRIRVGHVEAGLRTHDKWQPFPEEINRRVAGVAADLHFAPTEWARRNLLREGVPDSAIALTGNPVIDALQVVAKQPQPESVAQLLAKLEIHACRCEEPRSGDEAIPKVDAISARAGIAHLHRTCGAPQVQVSLPPVARNDTKKRLILVTAHRRENFGQPLENICAALKELAERGDVEIVYPVHLNPNVQEPVKRLLGNVQHVTLLPPLDYLPMVHLIKQSTLVLTDSGGIQEEAPTFGIPVLVLREVTERPEGVKAGVLKLVGTDSRLIVRTANRLLDNAGAYAKMAKAVNPFGDGQAAGRIVKAVLNFRPTL